MNLTEYLRARYPDNSLTRYEAESIGVPYPPITGWRYMHSKLEVPASIEYLLALGRFERIAECKRKLKERELLDGVK